MHPSVMSMHVLSSLILENPSSSLYLFFWEHILWHLSSMYFQRPAATALARSEPSGQPKLRPVSEVPKSFLAAQQRSVASAFRRCRWLSLALRGVRHVNHRITLTEKFVLLQYAFSQIFITE